MRRGVNGLTMVEEEYFVLLGVLLAGNFELMSLQENGFEDVSLTGGDNLGTVTNVVLG